MLRIVLFHSLRKNFTTAFDQASIAQADVPALLGHGRVFTFATHSSGPGLKRLRDMVEQVKYPGLRLMRLYAE